MSVAMNSVVDLFRPQLLIVVGIGGAVSRSISLGDVVIANQILSYGPRKETTSGPAHRGGGYLLDARLKPAVNELEIDWPKIVNDFPLPDRFDVHVGPIGAGPSVIANENSENIKWLKSVNSKVLAVETEAIGVAQYAYETFGSNPELHGYLVIRGMSDYADAEKNDDHHKTASDHAAEIAVTLCRYIL